MAVKKYPQQGEVWWVNLDPTIGKEINKKHTCLMVSPDDVNAHLATVIAAPITSTLRNWPKRIRIKLQRQNWIVALDQIRMIDNIRLLKKITVTEAEPAPDVRREMFAKA
jgi:mRNA interferase MazF